MARTVRDARLESRTARASLKVAGKPYYRALDDGLHLGYRKGRAAGKWVIRRHVGGDKVYEIETIGVADDTIDADGAAVLSFSQAQAEARRRFVEGKRTDAGLSRQAGPYTVKDALEDYLVWMERHRKTARNTRRRADGVIIPVLGSIRCDKLSSKQIRDWMDSLVATPARLRGAKDRAPKFRPADPAEGDVTARRRRATANRTLTVLKAALNQAWREGRIPNDDAWRRVTAFKDADAARIRYLEIEEAQRLINAADSDFRLLVRAALATGARFGELAALQVRDFNGASGTVHVRTSKSGKGRHVVLTEEGMDLFRGLVTGRQGGDVMLKKADGGRWGDSHQSRPMAETCERARISPPANFHALRHTYASLTIMNGAPLLVVAQNLGHSDTRMVERHYGHMAKSYMADAIRAAAPRFGPVGAGSPGVIKPGADNSGDLQVPLTGGHSR